MTEDNTNSNNKYFCKRCKDKNYLIECKCGICGQVRFLRDKRNRICFFINHHHSRSQFNWNYKFGRKKHGNYWMLSGFYGYPNANKEGKILEHVYFYQEYHKVCMLKWAVVHHIDPVREGWCLNMIWNLQGMMESDHIRYHNTTTKIYKKKNRDGIQCSECKSYKTYIQKNGSPKWLSDGNKGLICTNCYERRKRKWRKENVTNTSSYYLTIGY